jgi:hypothetical protein
VCKSWRSWDFQSASAFIKTIILASCDQNQDKKKSEKIPAFEQAHG